NEPLCAAANVFLASQANPTNFECTGRLHCFELEPDSSACADAQRAGLEERCFNVQMLHMHNGRRLSDLNTRQNIKMEKNLTRLNSDSNRVLAVYYQPIR
ncbi:hypothetical protein AMJ80_09285, partial [bacterium SM23_31]